MTPQAIINQRIRLIFTNQADEFFGLPVFAFEGLARVIQPQYIDCTVAPIGNLIDLRMKVIQVAG